ncbi:hypothetical protein N0V93_004802 [Gnomoniopsis smithogilvyi]|uniref:Uncharacterized protein n=1 Tax=Gnomoniopsis smithogilvyi TaxID=1191159 RepID=A0A9W8YTB8_9PEZI|nr:hypothetical protein N0V93_004802 [Gnomoniopsis smithogilvyi]
MAEDADQSEVKRQRKSVLKRRSALEHDDQSQAKRQKKLREKHDADIAMYGLAPIVQDSDVAKGRPKEALSKPDLNVQYIADEEQTPQPKKRFGRARQSFFDYISGVPPDPPAAKGGTKRAATRVQQSTSGPSLHAANIRPETVEEALIDEPVILAAEGISVIDFAYACRDIALAEGAHPRIDAKSSPQEMEEPAASSKTSMSVYEQEEMQQTISDRAMLTESTIDAPKPARIADAVSGNHTGASPEDTEKPSRDRPPTEETRQLPAPHKRVAQLRGTPGSSGIRKKRAKAKRPRPPTPPSRSRYGLRSGRKLVSFDGEGEEVESGQ